MTVERHFRKKLWLHKDMQKKILSCMFTCLLRGHGSSAGSSGADCKPIVRPYLLSASETLGNWLDGRISCQHSAPIAFLVSLRILFLQLAARYTMQEIITAKLLHIQTIPPRRGPHATKEKKTFYLIFPLFIDRHRLQSMNRGWLMCWQRSAETERNCV